MSVDTLSVRVYRSPVAGSTLYLGKGYADTRNTNGFVRFVPAGTPTRHPHDHEAMMYPYGEFCTADQDVIDVLDSMIKTGACLLFTAVLEPMPMEIDTTVPM